MLRTFDLDIIALGFPDQQGSSFAIEGIGGVRVSQELRQKDLKNVDHIEHGGPCLVDDVEADRSRPKALVLVHPFPTRPSNLDVEFHSQLIDIGVEDAVDESDAGRLVRVGVGELDVDFPNATLERSCQVSADTPS